MTIADIEKIAKQIYPDKSEWWIKRYARMASKIRGLERAYDGFYEAYNVDVTRLFVMECRKNTRSPGARQAIEDWEIQQAEFEGV